MDREWNSRIYGGRKHEARASQNGCKVGYRHMEGAPRGHNKRIVQVLCI